MKLTPKDNINAGEYIIKIFEPIKINIVQESKVLLLNFLFKNISLISIKTQKITPLKNEIGKFSKKL